MATFQRGNKAAKKLNGEQVLDIRQRYLTGEWTYGQLAIAFDVSLNTISNVVNGFTWRDQAGPELVAMDRRPPGAVTQEPSDQALKESRERLKALLQGEALEELDKM